MWCYSSLQSVCALFKLPVAVSFIQTHLMQSPSTVTRPSHHANASRTLFQNPWTQTTNSTPPGTPLPKNYDSDSDTSSTPNSASASASPSSPVAFLGLPSLPTALRLPSISSIVSGSGAFAIPISIERVRALEPRPPHPPIKVVKPDWGRHSSSTTSLKATWLGHAVRAAFPLSVEVLAHFFFISPRVFSSSSRVVVPPTSRLVSCSILSSPTALARLPGLASSAVCLPPAPSRSCPSFNSWSTRITSVFFCLLRDDRPVSVYKSEISQL